MPSMMLDAKLRTPSTVEKSYHLLKRLVHLRGRWRFSRNTNAVRSSRRVWRPGTNVLQIATLRRWNVVGRLTTARSTVANFIRNSDSRNH